MARRGENIRKRKDGRWEGRYPVIDPITGNKKLKSIYAQTYASVKEQLILIKNEVKNNVEPLESVSDVRMHNPIFLTEAAELWMDRMHFSKKHSTYIKYRNIYEKYLYPKFMGRMMGDSTLVVCENILKETVGLSDSLSKSIYCVTNQLLCFFNENYHTNYEKIRGRKSRISSSRVKTLTPAEQTKLLKELYKDMDIYKFGILLCLYTGLRLGELCALNWQDIDITRNLLYVNHTVQRISAQNKENKTCLLEDTPKSVFSRREIPIPDIIIPYLIKFKRSDGYVISENKPTEPRTYQYKFKRILEDAGIADHNFHVLRHTFATNCIAGGADIKSLSEILGHSSVNITLNRYVHPSIDVKRSHLNNLSAIYGQYLCQVGEKAL